MKMGASGENLMEPRMAGWRGPWASPCRLRVGSSGHFLFPGCAGLSLVREGPSWGAPCPRAVGLSLPVCPRCRRESRYHSPQVRVNDTTEQ